MPEPHPAVSAGVVLVNLGTPDEPTWPAVRRYLREFLSDRRVVDLPAWFWRPILELHILHGHARRSTAKYASVWYDRGSPLLVHMNDLAAGLRESLTDSGVVVEAAMRYGRPALGQVLADLRQRGCDRVLVVPMYPQFATSTTATVIDALSACLAHSQNLPEVRWVRSWPRDPGYIEAMAAQIERTWSEQGRPDFAGGDKLLLSYHGIPVSMVDAGDPYPEECQATSAALRQRLGLTDEQCPMTFQSKFSHSPWLTPATIDTVAELARAGVRRLDVFCPGFTVDCLETLEEIGLLNREEFLSHGGQTFVRVPCLNDSPAQLTALTGLIRRHLAGWLD
ncbi:MAG: ferrochelatase [Propionibacteriaceae bacterium]|jgi:ferrochelatase|nr:ferrochelatase [Propionibacteriaceae bacterium]